MPVLHTYADRPGAYVKSSLKGLVATFQVTRAGHEQLLRGGVTEGNKFPLSLLVDLLRSGEAYTGGSGLQGQAPATSPDQLELDFPEDAAAEALLPACEVTGTFEALHLTVVEVDDSSTARVLGTQARKSLDGRLTLSIPLPVLSLGGLRRLQDMGEIPSDSPAVERLRRYYQEDLTAHWERHRRKPKPSQAVLDVLEPSEPTLF